MIRKKISRNGKHKPNTKGASGKAINGEQVRVW